jgi:threonine/homoserine/homoserine lactone efflux protein
MNFNEIKEAVFVGIFLAFMIGPVFLKLIQISILKGARAALAFNFGVVLGDVFCILIAYFGSKNFLEKIKDEPLLYYIGGGILVVYGMVTVLNSRRKKTLEAHLQLGEKTNYVKLSIQGFLLNFINVGVLAFWLGMIVIAGSNLQMDPTKMFHYFSLVLVSYFVVDIGKIVLAKQLKKKLTPGIIVRIKRGMGLVLILFGALLILKGAIPKENLPQIKNLTSLTIHSTAN